jgi:hypothetical protein
MAETAEWNLANSWQKCTWFKKPSLITNDDFFLKFSSNLFEVTGFRSASIVHTYVYETYRIVYKVPTVEYCVSAE